MRKKQKKRSREAGFTIVELMVSLSLIMIVGTLLFQMGITMSVNENAIKDHRESQVEVSMIYSLVCNLFDHINIEGKSVTIDEVDNQMQVEVNGDIVLRKDFSQLYITYGFFSTKTQSHVMKYYLRFINSFTITKLNSYGLLLLISDGKTEVRTKFINIVGGVG